MKRLVMSLVMALSAAVLVVVPASPASAAYGCPGDRDIWRDYRDSAGTLAARTQGHWVSGQDCYQVVAQNQYYGMSKYMSIKVCDIYRENCKTDSGTYKYYAGPIYYPDGCVWIRSTMKDGNGGIVMDHWNSFGCD